MIKRSLYERVADDLSGITWLPWVVAALCAIIALCACCTQARASVVPAAEQQRIVATVIAAESAGEGLQGMSLVANVIANRARLQKCTPYAVVTARNQFCGYRSKNRAALYTSVKATADLLSKNIMMLQDHTNGALYFRQTKEPRFKWCKIETTRYKKHIFYK